MISESVEHNICLFVHCCCLGHEQAASALNYIDCNYKRKTEKHPYATPKSGYTVGKEKKQLITKHCTNPGMSTSMTYLLFTNANHFYAVESTDIM